MLKIGFPAVLSIFFKIISRKGLIIAIFTRVSLGFVQCHPQTLAPDQFAAVLFPHYCGFVNHPCFARLCALPSPFLQLLLCFSPPLLCFASFSFEPVLLRPGCVWLPGQGWFLVILLLLGASSGSHGNGGAQAFESFCAAHFLQFSFLFFLLKVGGILPPINWVLF